VANGFPAFWQARLNARRAAIGLPVVGPGASSALRRFEDRAIPSATHVIAGELAVDAERLGRAALFASSGACCDAVMAKPALEFFPVGSVEWAVVSPGVWERVLARDDDGVGLTRILRWEPGLDTSASGPAVHDYHEEVLVLSGSLRDLVLDTSFTAGDYACRPPGMVHGPWVSTDGCEMFEVRSAEPR
jgi:hypothetical protein